MKQGKVSVIITSYNRGALLARAVNSVLCQSYDNYEIIIVDDNSTDEETIKILLDCEQLSPKIQVIRNNKNEGANVCRNMGLSKASGEYYTGLDDDDYFKENRLEFLVDHFSEKYAFISDNLLVFDGIRYKKFFFSTKLISVQNLCKKNYAGNQIFTLLDRMNSINGFDPNLKRLQDQDAWLRLAKKYGNGKRFNKCTYVMDISHDKPRITTTIKTVEAYNDFYIKHKNDMEKKSIYYNELLLDYYSGKNIKIKYLIKVPLYFFKFFIKKILGMVKLNYI